MTWGTQQTIETILHGKMAPKNMAIVMPKATLKLRQFPRPPRIFG